MLGGVELKGERNTHGETGEVAATGMATAAATAIVRDGWMDGLDWTGLTDWQYT